MFGHPKPETTWLEIATPEPSYMHLLQIIQACEATFFVDVDVEQDCNGNPKQGTPEQYCGDIIGMDLRGSWVPCWGFPSKLS